MSIGLVSLAFSTVGVVVPLLLLVGFWLWLSGHDESVFDQLSDLLVLELSHVLHRLF